MYTGRLNLNYFIKKNSRKSCLPRIIWFDTACLCKICRTDW